MNRIKDKLEEIEKYTGNFRSIIPSDFNHYEDITIKAACERYVDKIVNSLIDLAFLVIKSKNLKLPESDTHAFKILFDNNFIDEKLFSNLKLAKGMRNVIVHQYGDLDDRIIFESLPKLIKDSEEFVRIIKQLL